MGYNEQVKDQDSRTIHVKEALLLEGSIEVRPYILSFCMIGCVLN